MNDMYDLFIVRDECWKIKNVSGVYTLFSDEKIPLYVGKSFNLRSRVKSHISANGNEFISMHTEKFYLIGIIYHNDLTTLNEKETEIIHQTKPLLNSSKVNYPKNFDLSSINEYERIKYHKCKQIIGFFNTCGSFANESGFCSTHDPDNFNFSWVLKGKIITTEMQRLLYESEYKKYVMYFYMNNVTFGKLLSEKTFAKIDYINEEIVLNFKKHIIIIDENETIRLEVRRQPYHV